MRQKFAVLPVMIIILAVFSACTTEAPQTDEPDAAVDDGLTIVLGDISDDPGEVIEGSQPLADYLAEELSDRGYTDGKVVIASSIDEMIQLLQNGEIDLYFDSVYPATLISDASGAQPILRRWKFNVEAYHTVIFASKESGITSLDELAGHMVAFDSPYSTSGYALPAVTMVESGLTLAGKQSYGESVDDDEVGFVFSYDDENTLQWVLRDLVSAGATDDYHYEILFPDETKEQIVVLSETEDVPRQVVVARSGLSDDVLDAIIDILTNAHETEAGMTALDSFQTGRFDEFPEGIDAALERMREMMAIVTDLPTP